MLFLCRVDIKDVGPTLQQHWVNASCTRGRQSVGSAPTLPPLSAAVTILPI